MKKIIKTLLCSSLGALILIPISNVVASYVIKDEAEAFGVKISLSVPDKVVYLDAGCWDEFNPAIFAHCWGGGVESNDFLLEKDSATNYYTTSFDGNYTQICFVRCMTNSTSIIWEGGDKNVWNQAADTQIYSDKDVYVITDWSEGSWETHNFSINYDWATDGSSCIASKTCSNCSLVTSETVTLGNGISSEVTTAATCLTKGITTYTATFINPEFTTQTKDVEDVDALDHDLICTHVGTTSEANSKHVITCSRCDYNSGEVSCDFEYEVITPATTDSTGLGRYTCKDCSYSYDVVIEKTGCDHASLTKYNEVSPTHDNFGIKEYWYCSDCEKYFSDEDCTQIIDDINLWKANAGRISKLIRVTFYSNGSEYAHKDITSGNTYGELPTDPTLTGYVFDGWASDNTSFTKVSVSSSTTFTSDTSYYARFASYGYMNGSTATRIDNSTSDISFAAANNSLIVGTYIAGKASLEETTTLSVSYGGSYRLYCGTANSAWVTGKSSTSSNWTLLKKISFTPNSSWSSGNAWFSVYAFGNGDEWYKLDNGVTYINPKYTSIIFVRQNSASSSTGWDNKWNQSGDIALSGSTNYTMQEWYPWDNWTDATTTKSLTVNLSSWWSDASPNLVVYAYDSNNEGSTGYYYVMSKNGNSYTANILSTCNKLKIYRMDKNLTISNGRSEPTGAWNTATCDYSATVYLSNQ